MLLRSYQWQLFGFGALAWIAAGGELAGLPKEMADFCKAVIPVMIQRGGGSIFNNSSNYGLGTVAETRRTKPENIMD